ncbi:MAG: glycosyltransferase family 4 protein [Alphaproteobacteria bacterium]
MSASPKVLIAHSRSGPLIRQIAIALQRHRYDFVMDTGYVHRPDSALARLVSALPAALRTTLERELARRYDPRVDASRVCSHAAAEILAVVANRFAPTWVGERATIWSDQLFDWRVARRIPPDTDIAIAQDGQSLNTIRAARRAGILAVLNQTTGFVLKAMETYREEARLNPEFADSLSSHLPVSALAYMRDEALEADRVLVPSEFVRDTLLEQGVDPARIAMLPYGVDVERFRPDWVPDPRGRFRILYVGNLGQKKGIKYLLEAVRRLARPDITLTLVGHVVGSGTGLAPYRHLFSHVPHVPYLQVHEMFRNADLFIYPSLHEGSAFANLEAMAAGLPVVTTHNAGSVARDGVDGFVVPIRSADAIIEAIERLRRDPARRAAMARAARARAEQFTWERYGDGLDELLRRFAERRP